jgi:small subunit ribosomal protein S6e
MAELKLVINDVKNSKSYAKALNEEESSNFMNLKIKDKIKGDLFGFNGYEFEIRGGTDKAGFGMRSDLPGTARKKALLTEGPGIHIKRKGMRIRKTIRGNTIAEDISQVNLKIINYGKDDLKKLLGVEEAKEEPKAEAPKEEVKVEPKEEAKVEEKPKEAPKETPKEEKPEEKKEVKSEDKPKEEKKEEPKVEEKPKEDKKESDSKE